MFTCLVCVYVVIQSMKFALISQQPGQLWAGLSAFYFFLMHHLSGKPFFVWADKPLKRILLHRDACEVYLHIRRFITTFQKSRKNSIPECRNCHVTDSRCYIKGITGHQMCCCSPVLDTVRTKVMTMLQVNQWWGLLFYTPTKYSNTVFVQAPGDKVTIWCVATGAGLKVAGALQELTVSLADGFGQRGKTSGKPNGKYESKPLALMQTWSHSLHNPNKHQNVLTSKNQEVQLKHRNVDWK